MGGNALSSGSVRLSAQEYARVKERCLTALHRAYPGLNLEAVGSYRNKMDFGDCDILVASSPEYDPLTCIAYLNATEVVRNGPVTSMGVRVDPDGPLDQANIFQVDLIKVPEEGFEFAQNYFGASDAGNLLGRVARAMGVVLRHDGLAYYLRDGDQLVAECVLTQDFDQALAFMGYDPQRWAAGFDELQDIYKFVASSPYFNPDIFLLHNRNAKSRVRDQKRPVYMAFLKWCEQTPGLATFHHPETKDEWLDRTKAFFPEFGLWREKALSAHERHKAAKQLFNGRLVNELTGLAGKDLGAFMREVRDSFESPESMESFILSSSPQEIKAYVFDQIARQTSAARERP